MHTMNPDVDAFISGAKRWRHEFETLRLIVLDSQLTEELKWRQPCYTFQNGNVVIMSGFKAYCALGFFKGSLLKDPEGILHAPGANSQSMRQIRFTGVREIHAMASIVKAYISEAVALEKAGAKVTLKQPADITVPGELKEKFAANPALESAFHALTPGRQRAYILHFSAPKLSKTRESRIDKCVQRILEGKGLDDR